MLRGGAAGRELRGEGERGWEVERVEGRGWEGEGTIKNALESQPKPINYLLCTHHNKVETKLDFAIIG